MKLRRLVVSSRIAELAILAGVVKADQVEVIDRIPTARMVVNEVAPASSARRNGPPNRAERRARAAIVRRGRVFKR